VAHQPLGGRERQAVLLFTGENQDVVIPLPFGGGPHALLMPPGIEAGTGTPGNLTVFGLRPGPTLPVLIQPPAAELPEFGSKPIWTIRQLFHSRILWGSTSPEPSITQRPRQDPAGRPRDDGLDMKCH
jgi:hypothetical protein